MSKVGLELVTVKYDLITKNYIVIVKEGDRLMDVLRAFVKASYALYFPYHGLGFLFKNPLAEIPNKEADKYIDLTSEYVINMKRCRGRICDTYFRTSGTPLVFYFETKPFENSRGSAVYLFSKAKDILYNKYYDENAS